MCGARDSLVATAYDRQDLAVRSAPAPLEHIRPKRSPCATGKLSPWHLWPHRSCSSLTQTR